MTREEAIEILKPFKACMFDQHGCPISDAAIALDVAIEALDALSDDSVQKIQDLEQAQLEKAYELGKEPEWIPCSERLPKQHQAVIVTDEGYVLAGYINSLNEWMDFHGNRLTGVIAWMPLPESYKGDKE